jgi:hypothetical protein
VRREPEALVQRLSRGLAAGDILLLHDGNAARTTSDQPLILAALPDLLARFAQAGVRAVTLPAAARGEAAA